MIDESPKRFWQRNGTVDYLRIETRPPSKRPRNSGKCQIIIESTPDGDRGSHAAFEAIVLRMLRFQEDSEDAMRFYSSLKSLAEDDEVKP